MTAPHNVQVFIGSSAEGREYARALQAELEAAPEFTVQRWDIGAFDPGSITIDALIERADRSDFAILVATNDDTITTRGTEGAAVRDNIIFEFGLFVGALGRERVYLLSVGDAKLPSDLSGLTRLIYRQRPDNDVRAGLNDAVLRAERIMRKLGPRTHATPSERPRDDELLAAKAPKKTLGEPPAAESHLVLKQGVPVPTEITNNTPPMATVHAKQALKALEEEINWLCSNAADQGWSVTKNNPTMLRLRSPKGKDFTLTRKRPAATRDELRKFVAELRANGLRANRALQRPAEDSPFG